MSKGRNKTKLTANEFALLALLVVLMFLFAYSSDKTINYPYYLWFYPSFLLTVFFFCFRLRANSTAVGKFKTRTEKWLFYILRAAVSFVYSICILAVLLIPFNYYNIYYAGQNISRIYNCKIVDVNNRHRDHSIGYIFENERNTIKAHIPEMDEMDSPEKYDRYLIVVKVKKGLLGSYVLQSWRLISNQKEEPQLLKDQVPNLTFIDSVFFKKDLSSAQIKAHTIIDSVYTGNAKFKYRGDTTYVTRAHRLAIIAYDDGTCAGKFLLVFKAEATINTGYELVNLSCDDDEGFNANKLNYKILNDTSFYTTDTYIEKTQGHKDRTTITKKLYYISRDGKVVVAK